MFDPFKDYEQTGYLRNVDGLKDLDEVKVQEHAFFLANIETALTQLKRVRGDVTYDDFLTVHRTLFQGFYPWAGSDRHMLGVGRLVGKGDRVQFEVAELCRAAVEYGLRLGNDRKTIRAKPGLVMGAFAWGHPFLDGNGRTMLVVHTELCRRAGFAIDWSGSSKGAYLEALTREISDPQGRHLDAYLLPFVSNRGTEDLAKYLRTLPGLAGSDQAGDNVAYAADDQKALQAYLDLKRARGEDTPRLAIPK